MQGGNLWVPVISVVFNQPFLFGCAPALLITGMVGATRLCCSYQVCIICAFQAAWPACSYHPAKPSALYPPVGCADFWARCGVLLMAPILAWISPHTPSACGRGAELPGASSPSCGSGLWLTSHDHGAHISYAGMYVVCTSYFSCI